MAELKDIIEKCTLSKGNSQTEISAVLENLKIDLDVQTLKERFKQAKIVQTADIIHRLKKNFPNILHTIYTEDAERLQTEAEDDILVLRDFEIKKKDMKYIQMLEKNKKKSQK